MLAGVCAAAAVDHPEAVGGSSPASRYISEVPLMKAPGSAGFLPVPPSACVHACGCAGHQLCLVTSDTM